MTSKTTAFIIVTMLLLADMLYNIPHYFTSASAFGAAYLILAQLEENNKSKNDNTDA